jgi:magnesium chelatase subunit I
MTSADYLEGIAAVPGLKEAVDSLGPFESPGLMAAATELLLEGLHLHERLNREREGGRFTYSA